MPFHRCDCDLEERLKEMEVYNIRERGFREMEVIYSPDHRSVIYACERCGRQFEGWFERGELHLIPVLEMRPKSETGDMNCAPSLRSGQAPTNPETTG